ncbi:MAG: 6-hydroxymethylpterin diphosphokinase MptE-like protein [Succinivibrio sp.]
MQQNIFDHNFKKLESHSKSFADLLNRGNFHKDYQIDIDEGKQVSLLIDGRQLTSHHDREALAAHLCRKIDFNREIHIYGYGLGDEIRFILKKSKDASVFVHLLNPGLFYTLLSIDDQIHELFVPNVTYSLADDNTPYYSNSVIITPELYIDPMTNNNLKGKLINVLDYDYAVDRFSKKTALINEKNLKDNYECLKNISPFLIDVIRNNDKNSQIMIAASGPSLDNSIDTIREFLNEGTKLIALDTSLSCLLDNSIIPDYIVSTDPVVFQNLHKFLFSNMESIKNSTLIFSAHSENALIQSFKGPKYFVYRKQDLRILDYLDDKMADYIEYAGSVLNEAVAIALKAEYKTVKLFGADFAFKDDLTHSGKVNKHAVASTQKLLDVLCNDGKIQKTVRVFNLYRQYLEEEIVKHPNTRFENYSKTGAIIRGTQTV